MDVAAAATTALVDTITGDDPADGLGAPQYGEGYTVLAHKVGLLQIDDNGLRVTVDVSCPGARDRLYPAAVMCDAPPRGSSRTSAGNQVVVLLRPFPVSPRRALLGGAEQVEFCISLPSWLTPAVMAQARHPLPTQPEWLTWCHE